LFLGDTPTSFDPTIRYIYFKQLEEARIVVVSKMDLLTEAQSEVLRQMMQHRYEDKIVLYQNSYEKDHITRWLKSLDQTMPENAGDGWADLSSLDIDYDRYGEGEARLAWLDQELEINGPPQDSRELARTLTENIYRKINVQGYPIGHLKFLLNGMDRINFTAASSTPASSSVPPHSSTPRPSTPLPPSSAPAPFPSTLLVNARVQTDPATLSRLVAESIRELEAQRQIKVRVVSEQCFQPGYPRPTHRISGIGLLLYGKRPSNRVLSLSFSSAGHPK
jgi:hypothetical protein